MERGNKFVPVAVLLGGLLLTALYLRVNTESFTPVAESLTFVFQLMLAGTVIALLRNEVGVSTFGVFGPAILAFSWLAVGPFWGFLLVSYVFVVAAAARVAIGGLDLGTAHRVGTLLVVAGFALFVMDSVGQLRGIPPLEAALLFPVVLTTWYAERFVSSLDGTGWAPASRRLGMTLVAISLAYLVAGYEPLVSAFVRTPEAWVGLVALNVAFGLGTDVRLGEYLRFRTLRRTLGADEDDVLTMRVRNRDFITRYNPAGLLQTLDKVRVKQTLHGLDVPTPETFLTVEAEADLDQLRSLLAERDSLVVKPVDGSGGEGVLVVRGRRDDDAFDTNRGPLTSEEIVAHARDIVTGNTEDYAARGRALVEALVRPDGLLADLSGGDVPDVRIITLHGYPVMAMARLPTEESKGTANLHGGAVGVAVDVATGVASGGYQQTRDRYLDEHPDTGAPLSFTVPDWEDTLEIASRASIASGLGYAGVDIVFDADRGPLVLEVNRRPGLGIQNVNVAGLLSRLRYVERSGSSSQFVTAAERVRRAVEWAAAGWTDRDGATPDADAPTAEVEA